MKCDELRIENACVYGPDAKVYIAEQVDEAIAELKARIQLDDDEMEGFLQLEEECGGGDLRNYIAELKQKLEDVQASHYAEMVDAGMRERRLHRALWLARALALSQFDVDEYLRKYTHCNSRFWNDGFNTFNEACKEMQKAINIAEAKCRAKAEQYK